MWPLRLLFRSARPAATRHHTVELSDPRRQPQRRHHQEESHCLTNKTSLMFFVKPSVPTIQPVRSTPVGVIHRLDHRDDDPGRAGARHVSGHNQHGDLQHSAREMVYPYMVHKVVGFQGVFSSNNVTAPWQPKDVCWIVNHSPSFSPSGGSHWMACRVQGNKAFWFDSYGLPPHAQLEIQKTNSWGWRQTHTLISTSGSNAWGSSR